MSSKKSAKTDQRVQELEEQLKRALADYQNLKRRSEKEKQEVVKFANEVLLLKVLAVLEGLEIIFGQFQKLLQEEGLERLEIKAGDKFDPELMEAVDGEGEKVGQVLSAAYKLYDKIVRPAKVRVRKS